MLLPHVNLKFTATMYNTVQSDGHKDLRDKNCSMDDSYMDGRGFQLKAW